MTLTSPEIRETHKTGIGASVSAKILGVSPFGGPMDAYLEIMGLDEPKESGPMTWGIRLEQAVADHFAETNGVKLRRVNKPLRMKDVPWYMCLPDRLITGRKEGVEIKTTSLWMKSKYGEEQTDQVPDAYIIQCQKCMHITGCTRWYLPVLIGGNEYKEYIIHADSEIQEMIFKSDFNFWYNHVLKKIPPAVDGSDASSIFLKRMFPRETEDVREATAEEATILTMLHSTKAQKKAAEEKIEELQNQVKSLIGNHAGLQINGYKATWKATKESIKLNEKLLIDELSKLVPEDIFEKAKERCTETKPGVRRFLLQVKEHTR